MQAMLWVSLSSSFWISSFIGSQEILSKVLWGPASNPLISPVACRVIYIVKTLGCKVVYPASSCTGLPLSDQNPGILACHCIQFIKFTSSTRVITCLPLPICLLHSHDVQGQCNRFFLSLQFIISLSLYGLPSVPLPNTCLIYHQQIVTEYVLKSRC